MTSLAGGVLIGHALLAASGRPTSTRVCLALAGALAVVEAVVVAVGLPDRAPWPGAAATLVVLAGAVVLHRSAPLPREHPAAA